MRYSSEIKIALAFGAQKTRHSATWVVEITPSVDALFTHVEVPSLWQGLRASKLYGRRGIITFESNGVFLYRRGNWMPKLLVPGLMFDIRGYRAMYRDFAASIHAGRQPEMSLERAMDDHRLMDQVYATAAADTARDSRGGRPLAEARASVR